MWCKARTPGREGRGRLCRLARSCKGCMRLRWGGTSCCSTPGGWGLQPAACLVPFRACTFPHPFPVRCRLAPPPCCSTCIRRRPTTLSWCGRMTRTRWESASLARECGVRWRCCSGGRAPSDGGCACPAELGPHVWPRSMLPAPKCPPAEGAPSPVGCTKCTYDRLGRFAPLLAACTWAPSPRRRRTARSSGRKRCPTFWATGSPPATSPVSWGACNTGSG